MYRFYRLVVFFVFFILLISKSFAAVTITTATGALGVSADKAAGSVSPAYTAIGDIAISSNTTTDFPTGSGTFTLNIPSSWQFQAGTGTAVAAGSITITGITVTSTGVTVTYTNAAANAANKITISGLAVQATVKTTLSSASITRASGGTTISGFGSGAVVGSVSAVAGAFVKLQLLLPGESSAPGTTTGKTGTPNAQSSGTAFTTVTVNAVDANWNRVTSVTDVIKITTTDANATTPANAALASGTKSNFSVTLRAVGTTNTITATDFTDGTKTASTSPAVTVNVGAVNKIQLLLPGETAAPGTTAGKTGTPNTPTAGTPFNVTVNAVDAGWNVVTSVTDVVSLTSTDANAALPSNTSLNAGTVTLSVTLKTAAVAKIITANDITTPARTASTSPSVTATAGAFVKLQLLVAGESASPGSVTGKTGTPTALNAGTSTTVTVNAVDANWNKVSTVTDSISIITNDPSATLPARAALVAGTKTFRVTYRAITTTATMTATDFTDGAKTSNTSPNITVIAGNFTKLLLLLPGETYAPGTATGKTGTPVNQVAGTPFTVTVYGVDGGFNTVSTATDEISITTTDVNSTIPANANLVAGVKTFEVTLKTASTSKTIKAADVTNTTRTSYTSPKVTITAASFSKLLVLMPGEVFAGGTATGKTSAIPTAVKAGSSTSNIKVYAVDSYFNKVTTAPADSIAITSTDVNAAKPAKRILAAGSALFSMTFKTLGSQTLTATDVTDGTKTASTSAPFNVIQGSFTKLLLLLPGETQAPGTTTGKTGTPSPRTAGTPFNITVYAVDGAWNLVNTVTDEVRLTSTDTYAALPATTALSSGAATLSVTFKTAGSKTIKASDVTNTAKTSYTSPAVTINAGAYSKLLIKLPGENFNPGSPTGKSGTANTGARNVAFDVVVNAVDDNYNLVNTISNTVTLSSSDAAAAIPPHAALAAGTVTFTGVNIRDTTLTPLPTLKAKDGAITTTIDVPFGTTPTATTDYFRTQKSGDWSDITVWESSINGTSYWQDATRTPTSSANVITVRNNHIVTVATALTVDQVVVEPDGEIDITSGTTLTLSSAGTGIALDVNGTINNAGTITTTGSLVFEAASTYQHNFTTTVGSVPSATWNDASTCEVLGYTTVSGTVGGTTQTFGNFVWNCPAQSGNLALSGTFSAANLTVLSTGTGTLQLGTTGGTVTVRKDFDLEDGKLTVNNTSGTLNLNLNGDFTMAGGTLQKGGGTANIRFAGTTTQDFVKTGGTISGAVSFTVNTNAIVDFGDYVLDGTASTFTLAAGGNILTNNELGFTSSGANGSIQTGGTRTYSNAANYTFSGSSAQVVGSGLPTTVNNLIINNPDGVTMPAGTANYTVTNQLSLTSGSLDMGINRLLTGTGFTTSGTGTLKTQNTSTTPIPVGKTWNIGIEYNGTANQTVVTGTYSNLAFSEAGTKTATTGTISVTGNWESEDGKVDLLTNSTDVAFTGAAQSLTDDDSDGGNGIVFKNVTFGNSGTKTLSAGAFSVSSKGLLTMAGTATLAANGNLTLLSDATGTGSIGPLSGPAVITGSVNVQTFVTGGGNFAYRGYRLLSSPISVPSAANAYYNFSFLKGSGTYLTGAGGSAKGFDVAGNPTLYLYREDKTPSKISFTEGNYRAVTAINNTPSYALSTIDGDFNMPVGNGFLFFYRGNNSTNTSIAPSDIVLSTLGTLNQGQIVVKNWFNYSSGDLGYSVNGDTTARGFNLVGNPYPSSIDWNTAFNGTLSNGIYAPNTDQTIYIFNATSKNYATYINTGTNSGVGTNGGSRIIPSGQGFFVHATAPGAQLVFNESAKVNAHPGTLLLNSSAPVAEPEIRLQLSKDSISKDENVFIFNNAAQNNYVKNEDALYLKGSGPVSLSHLSTDKRALAINQLPFPKKAQRIPLTIAVTSTGNYHLSLTEINNIPALYDIWLKDAFTNDSLDIKHNTNYDFTVSSDAATTGANRFKLIITPNPALTVHLLSFKAVKDIGNVKITWTAENEANYTHYALERSIDGGKTFIVLDSLTSVAQGTYDDLDPYPVKGENLYRLKQIDIAGTVSYSQIVKVMYAAQSNNKLADNLISLYPNPAKSLLNLAINKTTTTAANYKIIITSNNGVTVNSIISNQPTWQGDIGKLLPGTYYVQVLNLKDNSVIGRSSFIKL